MSEERQGAKGDWSVVMHRGRVCDEGIVRAADIDYGDRLLVGKDQWAKVDNLGRTASDTHVWCQHLYFRIVVESGTLATIRRPRSDPHKAPTSGREPGS